VIDKAMLKEFLGRLFADLPGEESIEKQYKVLVHLAGEVKKLKERSGQPDTALAEMLRWRLAAARQDSLIETLLESLRQVYEEYGKTCSGKCDHCQPVLTLARAMLRKEECVHFVLKELPNRPDASLLEFSRDVEEVTAAVLKEEAN